MDHYGDTVNCHAAKKSCISPKEDSLENISRIEKTAIRMGIYLSSKLLRNEEYYEKTAPEVTYAFCSFDGTDQEAEEHLKKIISMGPKLAMASRGARGCILYDGRNFYRQPAVPLTEVKDTLGAGDSLIASFLTGYIGRRKNGMAEETAICESLEEAAAFAAGICGMEGAFGYGKKYE